jgi:hypothetical protein
VKKKPAPKKTGPKPSPELLAQIEAFKTYKIGDSFFVPGRKASDLEYLRRPANKAGLGIKIRYIDCDPVHNTAGVRVWRCSGPKDEEL